MEEIDPRLIDFVASLEGFSSKAYKDVAGVWTIGFGETEGVYEGDTVTLVDAKAKLGRRLAEFRKGVYKCLETPLLPHELDALTSFAYNIGLKAFGNSTALRCVNDCEFPLVPEALLLWNKVTDASGKKVISQGIVNRRKKEAGLFENGYK